MGWREGCLCGREGGERGRQPGASTGNAEEVEPRWEQGRRDRPWGPDCRNQQRPRASWPRRVQPQSTPSPSTHPHLTLHTPSTHPHPSQHTHAVTRNGHGQQAHLVGLAPRPLMTWTMSQGSPPCRRGDQASGSRHMHSQCAIRGRRAACQALAGHAAGQCCAALVHRVLRRPHKWIPGPWLHEWVPARHLRDTLQSSVVLHLCV